jgi:hypothetical protein
MEEINTNSVLKLNGTKFAYFILNNEIKNCNKNKFKKLKVLNNNIITNICNDKYITCVENTNFKHCGNKVYLGKLNT